MFKIISNNLSLSPSTVHKRVRGNLGRKPLLNACDHQALRRYCLRNHHATTMDIATWAWEYFGKPLSHPNTVHRWIKQCNLNLYYPKRKAWINLAKKHHRVPWARSHLRWTERQCSLVGRVHISACFWNERTLAKYKKDHPDCYQEKVQKTSSVMVWGASVPTAWVICIYVKVPLMRRLGILERHAHMPLRQWLFPGTPCLFQQDKSRPRSARVTTAWLHRHEVCMLDWPACSPDLSPIENVWCRMKRRIRQ